MGPIMQEHTASTTLKRIVAKEKIRGKTLKIADHSKKGNKMKKAVSQMKNGLPGPGQDKDTVTTVQKGAQSNGGRVKCGSSRNTSKLSSPEDGESRPPLRKHSSVQRKEEKIENQRMPQCGNELQPNRAGMGKNRRALSLPLSPISGLRHMPMHPLTHSPAPTPEALQRHYNQKDEDTDSASDLSDSERLPVLPSPCTPCTPPHLNLRAEVIDSNDFPPDIPGPHGTFGDEDEIEKPSYSYQEFLPPPFNSWSLRQLAVFLHTEGRGAPRPKPVGSLEKYLERLLQLEWLQIQTVQAESSRPPGTRARPQSFPSATTAHQPRPHTAPPSRLNSPKGLRQSQRAFPFAPVNNPHHLPQLSTSSHAFQFALTVTFATRCATEAALPMPTSGTQGLAHCLSAELDPGHRRSGAAAKPEHLPPTAGAQEDKVGGGGGAQTPVSPSAGKSHLRHMQAAGNARKQPQESGTNPNCRGQVRKSRVRANSETDVKKVPGDIKGASADKRVLTASKREVITSKRGEKEWQKAEVGGQATKTSMKRAAKEPPLLSKAPLSNKQNVKTKNVHFVAK